MPKRKTKATATAAVEKRTWMEDSGDEKSMSSRRARKRKATAVTASAAKRTWMEDSGDEKSVSSRRSPGFNSKTDEEVENNNKNRLTYKPSLERNDEEDSSSSGSGTGTGTEDEDEEEDEGEKEEGSESESSQDKPPSGVSIIKKPTVVTTNQSPMWGVAKIIAEMKKKPQPGRL